MAHMTSLGIIHSFNSMVEHPIYDSWDAAPSPNPRVFFCLSLLTHTHTHPKEGFLDAMPPPNQNKLIKGCNGKHHEVSLSYTMGIVRAIESPKARNDRVVFDVILAGDSGDTIYQ